MLNNYPIKTKKQNEYPKFSDSEYLEISNEAFVDNNSSDLSADVQIEMSRSIHDMRRDFKRSVKDLKELYKDKAPMLSAYEYDTAKYAKIRHAMSHATG